MTEYLPQLLLAWSIQLVGVASPGPGVALILGVATSRGRAASLVTALGIACGAVVLAIVTVLGLAVIFAQIAGLMTLVRLIGAAYLAYLAWTSFRKALHPPALKIGAGGERSIARTALAGFLLQITNPKAIFFWLAVAGAGGVGGAPLPVVAVFVFGAFVNSLCGHGAYALVLSSAPVRRAYGRARGWIESGLGTFFLFASYKLARSGG